MAQTVALDLKIDARMPDVERGRTEVRCYDHGQFGVSVLGRDGASQECGLWLHSARHGTPTINARSQDSSPKAASVQEAAGTEIPAVTLRLGC
ncbi:hypothetical protein [Ralstonia sp.]|uniref:hypothetical protein n=1 Tax=Ralstonia sp. TaxID=54061 RepID=UPI00257D2333|nr:hypothetical protein [Ralstonia sp.]